MKQSSLKQKFNVAFVAIFLMIGMLFLTLTPVAAAVHTAGDKRRTDAPARESMKIENGIVTDDDGIIGNSATGADHSPRPHRTHRMHRPHRMRLTAAENENGVPNQAPNDLPKGTPTNTANTVPNSDPMNIAPDQLPNPVGRDITDDNATGDSGIVGDIVGDVTDGTLGGTNGNGIGGDQTGTPNTQDGDVSDNHDATIDDNGQGSTEDHTADDGNSSGVLPWIIAIIVLLAVVLVILALIPKKNKSH